MLSLLLLSLTHSLSLSLLLSQSLSLSRSLAFFHFTPSLFSSSSPDSLLTLSILCCIFPLSSLSFTFFISLFPSIWRRKLKAQSDTSAAADARHTTLSPLHHLANHK